MLSPPSWTYRHTWPETHAGIDPMPDKMGLDYLKLRYCEFQKYEVMTMSAEGGQPKRKQHAKPSYKATKHIERSFLISDYYQLQVTVHAFLAHSNCSSRSLKLKLGLSPSLFAYYPSQL